MIIEIDGVKLHYEVFGSGKPLLLLHGWGGCVNSMAPIWKYFQTQYQVLALDFPGQKNESSNPPFPWGVPEYANLVMHMMEQLNIKNPDVIAHSFGGRVAILLASQNPGLFHKMVLVDAAGVKLKQTVIQSLRKTFYQWGKHWIKITSTSHSYEEKIKSYREKHSSPDFKAIDSELMKQSFCKIVSLDLTNQLKNIQNSTLLIWGENDQDTPLAMAKMMEKNIPDAGLVVLKNAGHFSYLDAPNDFNKIVDTFLKENN